MPVQDFDAARRAFVDAQGQGEPDPVQFILCGETFTALREPMWGDVLMLWNAPELSDNEAAATLALQKFIRAMIDPGERQRYDDALFRLPQSHAGFTMMNVAAYIAEHMTGFPTSPLSSSVVTPRSTSVTYRESSGDDTTSSSSPPDSDAPSPTGTSPAASTPNKNGRSRGRSSSSRTKN